MLDRLSSYITDYQLWASNEKLLLAVSGGIDSMVMAHLIKAAGYAFGLAHVNHQLRGEESNADERLVEELAKQWEVPCHVTRVTIDRSQENIQERARELRYAFLHECCAAHGYDRILTAHHLNDRIETTLMNLMRGTGIYGMKGIPTQRDNIVRPLLWATKAEIEEYATVHQINFREDASNASDDYLRNRVRHTLVPAMMDLDSSVLQRLQSSLNRLEMDADVLSGLAQSRLVGYGDAFALNLEEEEMPWWEGLLYHAFRAYGVNRTEASEMATATVGARWEKDDRIFIRSARAVSLLPKEKPKKAHGLLTLGNVLEVSSGVLRGERYLGEQPDFDHENKRVWLALSTDAFPLCVRSLEDQDRFTPLGLNYSVNIRKYLLEKGANHAQLRNTIVVCTAQDEICWIPGWQVGEEFKFEAKRKSIVYLSFDPNGN
jgi:tRNA(Ile)-lysidine synthase